MAVRELTNGDDDGTRLGQSSTELVGFWGATPIAQKSGAAQATVAAITNTVAVAGVTTGALASVVNSFYSDITSLRLLVHELRNNLVSYGFIAGA